jgi:hypothetical protein
MDIVLTNQTSVSIPAMSDDDNGWCRNLEPGVSETISGTNTEVVIIGYKPSVTENIVKGLKSVGHVIEAWLKRVTASPTSTKPVSEALSVRIGNNGTNPIRVVLGDGMTANDIQPGATYSATSVGYIELRELGLVDSNITNPTEAS